MFLTDPKTIGIIGIVVALLAGGLLLCMAAVHQQSDTVRRVLAPTLFEAWSDQLEMFQGLPRHEPLTPRPARAEVAAEDPGPALIGEVRQYRRPTVQADSVYAAIVKLRKAGHTVLPRGEVSHLVDGEQIDYRELLRRAADLVPARTP